MEPLESPRVQQVGGILSRGEDTDGERTDDELDYRSESFVSQHQDEAGALRPLLLVPLRFTLLFQVPTAVLTIEGTLLLLLLFCCDGHFREG